MTQWLGHAVTVDANNAPNVSAKYWAGAAIAAASIPVGTAANAAGGLLTYGTGAGQINVDGAGNVRILGPIKRDTQLSNFPFYLVLSSDHVTGATGKTVTATRDIYDGNGFVACTNSPTEDAQRLVQHHAGGERPERPHGRIAADGVGV